MKVKEAIELTGGLSKPSKMPGRAWGIPAVRCHRGSELRKLEGSICSKCYAMKGRYVFGQTQDAYERRYKKWHDNRIDQWIGAMITLIGSQCANTPWFRWFDSGDLQNMAMLKDIIAVCRALPQINFWMSTRERLLLGKYFAENPGPLPANLTIRVAADFIGQPPPSGFETTCRVVKGTHATWERLISDVNDGRCLPAPAEHFCPAPTQDNECGGCRACWRKQVKNVVYKEH